MIELTTQTVQRALAASVRAADDVHGHAFATCVVDAGGHILGALRHHEAAVSAGHSAETKARTAVYLRADTGGVAPDSPYVAALTSGLPYPVNVFPGGLIIRIGNRVIGAVGVGGSTNPAHDLTVARATLEAIENDLRPGGTDAA